MLNTGWLVELTLEKADETSSAMRRRYMRSFHELPPENEAAAERLMAGATGRP